MKIVDKNNIPELKAQIKELTGKKIQVGILGDEALAVIAASNEFGVDIEVTEKMRNYLHYIGIHLKKETTHIRIPERAFLRITMDNPQTLKDAFALGYRIFEINQDVEGILKTVGLSLVSSVQDTIESNIAPPNSDITIERKGSAKTLQDEGRLKQGIAYKII